MQKQIRKILEESGLAPRKGLGQNFLIDKNILDKIIKVADLKKTDNVLEVGSGLGFLTERLIEKTKKVVAVEKDRKLFNYLQKTVGAIHELPTLLNKDILKITSTELKEHFKGKPYKIVANIPYNITSRFLKTFLESDYQPSEMILMVQKEVAERIIAKPGQMNLLALSVQFFSNPKILFRVSPTCFYPAPKVESAVIRLGEIKKDKFAVSAEQFFPLVKKGFSQKRKQLLNLLEQVRKQKNKKTKNQKEKLLKIFEEIGLKPTARAQELGLEDWVNLVRKIH